MKSTNSYPELSGFYKKKEIRPTSFSEGYNIVNDFPLNIVPVLNSTELMNRDIYREYDEEKEEVKIIKKDYVEIIYNKIIGFTFHLVLIASFEIIFFNYYIIQYENNAVISLSDQLVQPIINSCSELSNTNKIIVADVLKLFINQTLINDNAINDKNNRVQHNNNIFNISIVYVSGVIIGFLFILLINLYLKRKIDFIMIIIDNLIMISILGIYEYAFFQNIIFNYLTLGSNELIKNVVTNVVSS